MKMHLNFDRLATIVGTLASLAGILVSVYLTKTDANTQLIALSGWIASILITLALSIAAFITIGNITERVETMSRELERARLDTNKHRDNLLSQRDESNTYKNIATALAATINPDASISSIRNKLAAHQEGRTPSEDQQ